MSSHTAVSPHPKVGIHAASSSPVIVATDGREQSDGALRAGPILAGDAPAWRPLTVLPPMPIVTPEAPIPLSPDVVAARRAGQRRQVEEQLLRVLPETTHVGVELQEGDPATVVARVARESNATLIVCGLGRHKIADRVFGDETALRLIRVASVPVLAVGAKFARAPRRIVVAVDFSETSLRAARFAMQLAAENATIYLAHVGPRDNAVGAWNGWGMAYKEDAGATLIKLSEGLRVPPGISIQRVLLQGDPATELLAFAASVSADLIATGSHGHGFVTRLLIGSVATKIIRTSTFSVLTIPHAAAMTNARTTVAAPTTTRVPRSEWAARLREFGRRNLACTTSLEVDDLELGAQAQVHDYPLLGASYDPRDECVQLMLGDLATVGRHFTRNISGVDSVDVMTNAQGHDIALRIAHGAGQTLLTIT